MCERGCACECARCRRRREPAGLGAQGRGALGVRSRRAPESGGAGAGEALAGRALGARPCRTRSGDPLELEEELTVSVSRTWREGFSWPGARGGGGAAGRERGADGGFPSRRTGSPAALVPGREQVGSRGDRGGPTCVRGPFVISLSVGSLLPSSSAFWIGRRPADPDCFSLGRPLGGGGRRPRP